MGEKIYELEYKNFFCPLTASGCIEIFFSVAVTLYKNSW